MQLDERLRAFAGDLFCDFVDNQCSDIDGAYFQDLLEKHGFVEKGEATPELCTEEWAQEYGVEPGDPVNLWSDEMKQLMKDSTRKYRLEKKGWVFCMVGPNEWSWIKFDKDGNQLAVEGGDTWKEDLKS